MASVKRQSCLWHKGHDLGGVDVLILPGGFAYGDYLRAGAIARFSPIMREVCAFADGGGRVLAICNGFQIACEAGLLPGALVRNAGLHVPRPIGPGASRESTDTAFTNAYAPGQVLRAADRAWRGPIRRRSAGDRRTRRRRPGSDAVRRCGRRAGTRGQSERFDAQHRRHHQCRRQCPWPDAPSGARSRFAARSTPMVCPCSSPWSLAWRPDMEVPLSIRVNVRQCLGPIAAALLLAIPQMATAQAKQVAIDPGMTQGAGGRPPRSSQRASATRARSHI